jgi:transcriptional regulator with XRE-family HTH domain
MDWGASRILALRKHAEMTQAQFAQWLGVSIKQVKYLEHQRRNPSGPTRRLLDILAVQFHFNGTEAVLVLGTDTTRLRPPARKLKPLPAASAQPHEDGNGTVNPPETPPSPLTEKTDPRVTAIAISSDDDAFVWR